MAGNDREANLLGALVLASCDRLAAALSDSAHAGTTRAAALANLFFYEGDRVDDLAQTLGITGSGATRLVNQLCMDDLVEKRAANDGRAVALHLTAEGRKTARRTLSIRSSLLDEMLSPLSESERISFGHMVERILGAMSTDAAWADQTCRLCDISACPQDTCPVALACTTAN